jgi:peptidoglycan/xylan/chitin deacetylase (PgdA/CDA1 family)
MGAFDSMNSHGSGTGRVSPAMITGLAAFMLALIMAFVKIEWAAAPLSVFLLLCLAAPFFPFQGFFLPIVSRGNACGRVVAVTFDDGPDPVTTGPLLHLLQRHDVKAVFFVTGVNAEKNGDLIGEILAQGHDIGNHSYRHDPFLMLRPSGTLAREIDAAQTVLHRFGISPIAFRPPVGITSPKLAAVLKDNGLYCLTFSCRANDFGNRRIDGLAGKILKKVKPNDIILLHDVLPRPDGDADRWLHEVDDILSGLKHKGLQVRPLAELIGKPIMTRFTMIAKDNECLSVHKKY